MANDRAIEAMLAELRAILLDNSTFPNGDGMPSAEIRGALAGFRADFKPAGRIEVTPELVYGFIRRHRVFESLSERFRAVKGAGKVVIIEGADGTGKTQLAASLGKRLGALALENQAANVFERMFGLPRKYKIAVVDYNPSVLIGLLFYCVVNTVALNMVFDHLEKGGKYGVLDSSMIRTMASNVSRPAMGKGAGAGVVIDEEVYSLITEKLNVSSLDMLCAAKGSVLVVFLYASEEARLEQVAGRTHMDDYDTNRAYAEIINDFLLQDQNLLRERGMDVVSMLMVGKGEKPGRAAEAVDVVLPRTDDQGADISRKTDIVVRRLGEI